MMMARIKKVFSSLLCVAVFLSTLALPSSAEGSGTYTVSLPTGWNELGNMETINAAEDYIVTLPQDLAEEEGLLLVYAEFDDDSICALTGSYGDKNSYEANKRRLPAACINGDFELKTWLVTEDDMTPSGIGLSGSGTETAPYEIWNELDLLKLMAVGSLIHVGNLFFGAGIHYALKADIMFHTPLAMEIGYLDGEYSFALNAGKISVSMIGYGYKISDGISLGGVGVPEANPFFHGTFDGQGHSINGLHTIPDEIEIDPNSSYPVAINAAALFGFCDGTIKNLTVTTSGEGITKNRPYSSILVAVAQNAIIENCHAVGTVKNSWIPINKRDHAASMGLIAGGTAKTVSDCTAKGSVVYTPAAQGSFGLRVANIGGLVSRSEQVRKCVNYADVTLDFSSQSSETCGSYYVGGVVSNITGTNDNGLSYCANYGTISVTPHATSGSPYVGGLAGQIVQTECIGCYSVGTVNANNITNSGAFAGHLTATVKASFASGYPKFCRDDDNPEVSYCYLLGAADGSEDETAAVKTLSAASLANPNLVDKLNSQLEEAVFVYSPEHPVFSWLAAPSTADLDLVAEGRISNMTSGLAGIVGEVTDGIASLSVICSKACVVLYTLDEGATYTRLPIAKEQTEGDTITRVFTVTYADGMCFAVAIKGDVNGDGKLTAAEVTQIKATQLRKLNTFTPLQFAQADLDGNGKLTAAEVTQIKAAQLKKIVLTW